MKTDDLTPAGCTLAIFYFPVMLFIAAMAHGFALVKLWAWFVVPIFHLPALNIPQALGLGLVVGLLTKDLQAPEDSEDKSLAGLLIGGTVKSLVRPGFALLFGWIVLKFM